MGGGFLGVVGFPDDDGFPSGGGFPGGRAGAGFAADGFAGDGFADDGRLPRRRARASAGAGAWACIANQAYGSLAAGAGDPWVAAICLKIPCLGWAENMIPIRAPAPNNAET